MTTSFHNLPICDLCWIIEHEDREPTRLKEPDVLTCYRCGRKTTSGIFVRRELAQVRFLTNYDDGTISTPNAELLAHDMDEIRGLYRVSSDALLKAQVERQEARELVRDQNALARRLADVEGELSDARETVERQADAIRQLHNQRDTASVREETLADRIRSVLDDIAAGSITKKAGDQKIRSAIAASLKESDEW